MKWTRRSVVVSGVVWSGWWAYQRFFKEYFVGGLGARLFKKKPSAPVASFKARPPPPVKPAFVPTSVKVVQISSFSFKKPIRLIIPFISLQATVEPIAVNNAPEKAKVDDTTVDPIEAPAGSDVEATPSAEKKSVEVESNVSSTSEETIVTAIDVSGSSISEDTIDASATVPPAVPREDGSSASTSDI